MIQIAGNREDKRLSQVLSEDGLNGGIRTHDPEFPKLVRYQTALRSGKR